MSYHARNGKTYLYKETRSQYARRKERESKANLDYTSLILGCVAVGIIFMIIFG